MFHSCCCVRSRQKLIMNIFLFCEITPALLDPPQSASQLCQDSLQYWRLLTMRDPAGEWWLIESRKYWCFYWLKNKAGGTLTCPATLSLFIYLFTHWVGWWLEYNRARVGHCILEYLYLTCLSSWIIKQSQLTSFCSMI